MAGYIIVEVRDSNSGAKIGGATVDVASGPLAVNRVSSGIYFGFGSNGQYTLRVSASNYVNRSKRVEIAGILREEIIHLTPE
jgi:hypothetical protein